VTQYPDVDLTVGTSRGSLLIMVEEWCE
jgi:hypothetical protein